MGIVFNPLTGQLDFTGIPGGGPSAATRYTLTFNNTTDWVHLPPEYAISIPAATHGKGLTPNVQVYELVGLDYELINASILIDASGNVAIRVSDTPDNRFNGLILII